MAGEMTVKADGFARVGYNFGTKMPAEMMSELKKVIRRDLRVARSRLLANVSGGYLKQQSGTLAKTIKTSLRQKKYEIAGRAGSKYYIGRFWNMGYTTKQGKVMAPRPWATSVQEDMKVSIQNNIRIAIDQGLDKGAKG